MLKEDLVSACAELSDLQTPQAQTNIILDRETNTAYRYDAQQNVLMSASRVSDHAVKCPRCYRRTHEGSLNFDGLCDRCCRVILDDFPQHWSVQGIKDAYARQKSMTPADWNAHNAIFLEKEATPCLKKT